jgi:hypothetical protein
MSRGRPTQPLHNEMQSSRGVEKKGRTAEVRPNSRSAASAGAWWIPRRAVFSAAGAGRCYCYLRRRPSGSRRSGERSVYFLSAMRKRSNRADRLGGHLRPKSAIFASAHQSPSYRCDEPRALRRGLPEREPPVGAQHLKPVDEVFTRRGPNGPKPTPWVSNKYAPCLARRGSLLGVFPR